MQGFPDDARVRSLVVRIAGNRLTAEFDRMILGSTPDSSVLRMATLACQLLASLTEEDQRELAALLEIVFSSRPAAGCRAKELTSSLIYRSIRLAGSCSPKASRQYRPRSISLSPTWLWSRVRLALSPAGRLHHLLPISFAPWERASPARLRLVGTGTPHCHVA